LLAGYAIVHTEMCIYWRNGNNKTTWHLWC